ncbi:cupin domain-containing protein [Phenylobacterium sp.]|uniref:cupin domain-containing protein n=1 Tax=Phenylobacterium sp. TaxID=1871053 RepID=UPI0035ADBA2B
MFGWPELNRALAEHRLTPPRLRLERGGDWTKGLFRSRRTRRGELMQDLDPAVLTERLRDGATLILDAANELSPPLQALCAGLAADFACSSQANLYACWGTSQGFDVHWDDHDVLVIQVEGRKHWRLYGATRPSPTRKDLHAEHPKPAVPIEELVLEPGDILYLPRGYWHAAVGLGEPTLHLTVGLTRKAGSDFLHWLADHLLSEADVRADLPFEQGDAVMGAHLSGLLARAATLDPEALGRAYRRHVEAAQAQRPELSFPRIGRPDEAFGPQTRFTLADGAARVIEAELGEVVLSWRGTEFRVAHSLAAPLRALAERRILAYADIEAALPEDQRDKLPAFLGELVRRGALVVQGRTGA